MSIPRSISKCLFVFLAFHSWALASHPDVVETVKPSVVKVSTSVWEEDPFTGVHRHEWGGSGVVVALDHGRAYILTNRHVADLSWYQLGQRWCEVDALEIDCMPEFVKEHVVVTFADGKSAKAILHWRSPCSDLALLEAHYSGNSARAAVMETSSRVGEEVFALGHPLGLEYTLTKGIVSARRTIAEGGCNYDAIQTDANINPGNSGGGLFNSAARVVGINTWKLTGGEGLGFAISIAHYLREIGQDPSTFVHQHESPAIEASERESASESAQLQHKVYLWVGSFVVSVEFANGEKGTFEVTDALGLYPEDDFEFARTMEIEARKEIIKQFLLRRYGGEIARVSSVDFRAVHKQEYNPSK